MSARVGIRVLGRERSAMRTIATDARLLALAAFLLTSLLSAGEAQAHSYEKTIAVSAGQISGLSAGSTTGSDPRNTSETGANVSGLPLAIVKRAFTTDGTPLSDGAVAPKGSRIKFLLYIDNDGGAVTDVRLSDVLDLGFAYEVESMRSANITANCATSSCTGAEEQAIFDDAVAGAALTDAADTDVATFGSGVIEIGKQNAGNAQLDIADGKVWAIVFTVKVQ